MKFLANTSAIGLLALVAGFAAIIFYGLQEFGWMGLGWTSSEEGGVGEEDHLGEGSGSGFTSGSPFASASASGSVAEEQEEEVVCAQVNLFPLSLDHFSNWFGVAAFCYGVPPLQFSLQVRRSSFLHVCLSIEQDEVAVVLVQDKYRQICTVLFVGVFSLASAPQSTQQPPTTTPTSISLCLTYKPPYYTITPVDSDLNTLWCCRWSTSTSTPTPLGRHGITAAVHHLLRLCPRTRICAVHRWRHGHRLALPM